MVEIELKRRLGQFINCPIFFEVPADAPAKFLVIEKTGSSCENKIYNSMVAIQSYDETMQKAAELNDAVKNAMLSKVADGNQITGVFLNSDYNYTDTQTKRYRYQAVFDVYHYEVY